MSTATLIEWADMIDNRLEAIGGRTADTMARMLRRVAAEFEADRRDHDLALRDAISETARCADELAFWRYQAIYHRSKVIKPELADEIYISETPAWKEAERDLEGFRADENRERSAHAEAPRDPGGT